MGAITEKKSLFLTCMLQIQMRDEEDMGRMAIDGMTPLSDQRIQTTTRTLPEQSTELSRKVRPTTTVDAQ